MAECLQDALDGILGDEDRAGAGSEAPSQAAMPKKLREPMTRLATFGEHVPAFGERLRSCACHVAGRWCISVCVGACGLLVAGPWSWVFGLITYLPRYFAEK